MICPVCGAPEDSVRPWTEVRSTRYYRCERCAYIRIDSNKIPSAQAEKARYRLHRNDPEDPGYREYLETFIDRAIVPYVAPEARVLDFGSGPVPALSDLLVRRGYRVSSYDPYFAPDTAPLAGPYDLAAVHEVAEHLKFPHREFSRLLAGLSPGGRIAIRTRYAPDSPQEFSRWWYREDPTHVGFFGSLSIAALADRLGLSVAADDGKELAILESA